MGTIRVTSLKPGMILAEDVKDVRGRLLLAGGRPVGAEHIRIFKIWGIPQVEIKGAAGAKEKEAAIPIDPRVIERLNAAAEKIFRHTDRKHPAVNEMFNLAILHRAVHGADGGEAPPLDPPAVDPPSPLKIDFLQKFMEKRVVLPEIPSIVYELNEVISNPLSSADRMAQVINKSPSLTALLLKIVNSSFYGLPSRVDRVSLAVTLIGTREISALALGISILSMFKKIPSKLLNMQSFLHHCLACGIVSRLLAAQKSMLQTEQMFTSGLLHDLGRLIVLIYFPEEALAVMQQAEATSSCLYMEENRLWGCHHAQIGKFLMNQWKLPLSLENAVYFHHEPAEAPEPVSAAIVHVADILVNALGIGTSGERLVPPLEPKAWESLKLPVSCLEVVTRQVVNQLKTLEFLLQA